MSKGRPRFGRGRVYTPQETVDAEEAVAWAFRQQVGPFAPDCRDVAVALQFHTATGGRRDLDNMIKLALDALNGTAWIDDIQVVSLSALVFRESPQPCTDITITTIGDA